MAGKPKCAPLIGVLFVALLTTGCTGLNHSGLKQWWHNGWKVGPDYRKPAAPVAGDWIDYNNPQVVNAQQGVDDALWWTSLNDPVLNGLVLQAYEQNLDLRAAGMRVLEARTQRAIAAGLLLPQFQQAAGDFDHIQISRLGNRTGLPLTGRPRSFDLWTVGFNAAWELDVWGRFRRNLESADATVDASIEDYDDILVCLIAETAATYIEIRAFEQRLAYARRNVEIQENSLSIAKARFENGIVDQLDVSQAIANVAQTKALIPVLEKGLRLANNRLCVLTGRPPHDLQAELGEATIPAAPPQVVVGIPAELLRRRPDVRRSERQIAAQSALIGVAAADLFPAFSITGSINWQANKFSDLFDSRANAGNIAPGFNWNILNYGRLKNNVRFQEARFQELALLYQQTVLEANAEVENGITSYLRAQERVKALQEGVEASKQAVELAVQQYSEGVATFNRVFNLQVALANQQDELAAAQAETTLGLIQIYKALGGGWQIRLQDHGAIAACIPVANETSTTGLSSDPVIAQPSQPTTEVAPAPSLVTSTDAVSKGMLETESEPSNLQEPIRPKHSEIAPSVGEPIADRPPAPNNATADDLQAAVESLRQPLATPGLEEPRPLHQALTVQAVPKSVANVQARVQPQDTPTVELAVPPEMPQHEKKISGTPDQIERKKRIEIPLIDESKQTVANVTVAPDFQVPDDQPIGTGIKNPSPRQKPNSVVESTTDAARSVLSYQSSIDRTPTTTVRPASPMVLPSTGSTVIEAVPFDPSQASGGTR